MMRRLSIEGGMHVAVSGGTGFIGRPLLDRLLQQGHQVRLLTRDPQRVPPRPGVQVAALLPAPDLAGCDAAVSFAGEPISQRWTAAALMSTSVFDGSRFLSMLKW